MNRTLSKRHFLRAACCGTLGFAAAAAAPVSPARAQTAVPGAAPGSESVNLSPDEALALLKKGNDDFVNDRVQAVHLDRDWRLQIAKQQHPFAVLVGCSDSRVPPELLFGRGLGDLFIVRVAGNTVDLTGLGSIEYAVDHLGAPLVVVLGHERCGAVGAAIELVEKNAVYDDAIEAMVAPILPSVLRARQMEGDLLDNSVRLNVINVVERLKKVSGVIAEKLEAGTLKIVGARYDLDDARVKFIA